MPRDVASRAAKERCDAGFGVNEDGAGRIPRLQDRHRASGQGHHQATLRQPVRHVRGDHRRQPLRAADPQIFPAVHYTMGGIWVDYNLMTTIPGLYAIGEANFSDHGANRLGASALMQGLADGYFVLPYTIGDYLSHKIQAPKVKTDTKAFDQAEKERQGEDRQTALDRRQAIGGRYSQETRPHHVGERRHGPHQGVARKGDHRDPGTAQGVLEGREGRRQGKRLQRRAWKRRSAWPISWNWAS